jgi:hypothetical protein
MPNERGAEAGAKAEVEEERGDGLVVLPIAGIAPLTTSPPIPVPDTSKNTAPGMRGRGRGRPRGRPRGRGRGGRGGVRSVIIDEKVAVHSLEDSDDTSKDIWYEIG